MSHNLCDIRLSQNCYKEDYFITKFDQSMLMSTYVMAIVISDYDLRRVLKLMFTYLF